VHVASVGKMQLQTDRDTAVRMQAEAMAMLNDDDRNKVKRRAAEAK
jgi:hypothetical protein